ncbi:MAG: DUF1992 domain-containing protein [Kibdelosporangium sp.]
MPERKPVGLTFETWIDKQIREATERGDFDELPGTGRPLPGADRPHDEHWWVKNLLKREELSAEAMLPPALQLRRAIERLPETVAGLRSEHEVRTVVAELNQRVVAYIRAPSGPRVPVGMVDADTVVHQWKASRPAPVQPASAPAEPPPSRWWRRRRA